MKNTKMSEPIGGMDVKIRTVKNKNDKKKHAKKN